MEMESTDTIMQIDLFQNAPSLIQNQSSESIQKYIDSIHSLVDYLEDGLFRMLLEIKGSKRYEFYNFLFLFNIMIDM
jgi:hypothetical protein